MLWILSDDIGGVYDSKDGYKDVLAGVVKGAVGVHDAADPEDETLDNDDSGSSHSMEEWNF